MMNKDVKIISPDAERIRWMPSDTFLKLTEYYEGSTLVQPKSLRRQKKVW